jgi:cyclopropane-fatty-acyl-phospholipid synthase
MNPTTSAPPPTCPQTAIRRGLAWLPRSQLEKLLAQTHYGSLRLELPDGRVVVHRGRAEGPHATLQLHRWRALRRLLTRGDLGVAEGYWDGDWSTPDLVMLLEFGVRNEAPLGAVLQGGPLARLIARVRHLLNANSRRGSRRNIAAHYDLGNDFYAAWLDPQLLSLQPNQAVLEIGCGWGALAIDLARRHDVRVTGLTLSQRQLEHARAEVAKAGLQASVELRLQDYRDVRDQYDRIVSIEMLEAVGEAYWPRYFETVRERLKPGGCAVVQVILIDDKYFPRYRESPDFIQRHIFPGGMLPCDAAVQEHAVCAGLQVECTDRFGASYARTLFEWRQRFEAAWPELLEQGFDAAFRRLWRYYLSYCEVGFRTGRLDVALYRLRHA